MKLTFPSIGHSSVIISTLLRSWGVDFTEPKKTTDKTVEKALLYAPEGACMPFKTVMGNMLEGYEAGADTGIFFGGCGPCSFGFFSTTMNEIFKENNIDFRVLTLEFGNGDLKELYSYIKKESGKNAFSLSLCILPALFCIWYLDRFENYMLDIRADIETIENRLDFNVYEEMCYDNLLKCKSFFELALKIYKYMVRANTFKENRYGKLKIGIVGDIFSTIDGFSNYEIQKLLADNAVITRRSMSISKWIYEKIPFSPNRWRIESEKYMKKHIGGFARETVGYTSMWSKNKDGIIQIYPLNCMPETAASSILPVIHEKTGVPLLQLVVDEGAGKEGYITRVEAFCEMIRRKKECVSFEKQSFSRG